MQNKRFDKRKVYEEQIKEKVSELKELCTINDIPFFFTACVANDDEKAIYVSEGITPESYGFSISDNCFTNHINVSNGFDTVPKEKPYSIDL